MSRMRKMEQALDNNLGLVTIGLETLGQLLYHYEEFQDVDLRGIIERACWVLDHTLVNQRALDQAWLEFCRSAAAGGSHDRSEPELSTTA